jgi:hypothetical protein
MAARVPQNVAIVSQNVAPVKNLRMLQNATEMQQNAARVKNLEYAPTEFITP